MSNNEINFNISRGRQMSEQEEILQRIIRKKVNLSKEKRKASQDQDGAKNNHDKLYSSSLTGQSIKIEDVNEKEKFSIKFKKTSSTSTSQVKLEDASDSDWFQDAIKRAKDKANLVLPTVSGVSLSADSLPPAVTSVPNESKKRKSRWGVKSETDATTPPTSVTVPVVKQQQTNFNMPINIMGMVGQGQHMEAIQGIMISKLTRSNPAIINYALHVFGSLDITDSQWKQCEEQMKMNIVFQVLEAKKVEADKLLQQGKVKYEYDSDEDIDGGTWEHKRRKLEMAGTATRATEQTIETEGKHHIGDFLPPKELSSFIEKYSAIKEGRDPDLSDYRDNRITEDNVGYKMLKSMGWTEGAGLGADGKGITAPVNQKPQTERQGVGAGIDNDLQANDDEFDAYRKRMMLAYRYRPNPLNNPRRTYY